MSYIPFNGSNKPRAQNLRIGIDQFRDGWQKLLREMDDMSVMSDEEVKIQYDVQDSADVASGGQTALQNAASLKAELLADISKLQTDDQQVGVNSALKQLLRFLG
jgi:hypothetical protein